MSGIIRESDVTFVKKSWGWEKWICNSDLYCGKILFIEKDNNCSFHFHALKDEVLYLHSGRMLFNYAEDKTQVINQIEMTSGNAFHVQPGFIHQMVALEDCVIIETSTQHFDSDSYRITQIKVEKDKLVSDYLN